MKRTKVLESIAFGLLSGHVVEHVTDCDRYYLLAGHKIAIPVTVTAPDTFHLLAGQLGDWSLPESVTELPTASKALLDSCLPDYTIIPVLRNILVTKPIKVLSPMEEDIIRESKKRNTSIQSKKTYITGVIEL